MPCDSLSAKGSVLSDDSVSDCASQGGRSKTIGKGGSEKIIISASSFLTSSDGGSAIGAGCLRRKILL